MDEPVGRAAGRRFHLLLLLPLFVYLDAGLARARRRLMSSSVFNWRITQAWPTGRRRRALIGARRRLVSVGRAPPDRWRRPGAGRAAGAGQI